MNNLIYKEHSIIYTKGNDIYRLNCIERLADNMYTVISMDGLYGDGTIEDLLCKDNIYNEQLLIEIQTPHLKWFRSLENAIDSIIKEFIDDI